MPMDLKAHYRSALPQHIAVLESARAAAAAGDAAAAATLRRTAHSLAGSGATYGFADVSAAAAAAEAADSADLVGRTDALIDVLKRLLPA